MAYPKADSKSSRADDGARDKKEVGNQHGDHVNSVNLEDSIPFRDDDSNAEDAQDDADDDDFIQTLENVAEKLDEKSEQQRLLIATTEVTTPLEIAQRDTIHRLETQVARLTSEVIKLKKFISKRKQQYKRKRKEEGAPTRALSAYNIFIKERFKKLASENEKALQSDDTSAELKRVPPASLVASTGNEWRNLSQVERDKYEKM